MSNLPNGIGKPKSSMVTVNMADLSKMLGVSRTTIHRMKCADELPPTIPTKRRIVRWLAKDIDLWLDLDCPCTKNFIVYKRDLQRYTRGRQRR